jgi:hypothetical protein
MKLHGLLLMLIIGVIVLIGCSTPHVQAPVSDNLTQENWMQKVNLSSNNWIRNADPWFLTGEPNQLEQSLKNTLNTSGTATTAIQVAGFNNLVVNGPFQVQIIGGQDHDSVFVFGPYDAARQVLIQNSANTLRITLAKDCKVNLGKVIVRIGVRNLKSITNLGSGNIYGRNIYSNGLILTECSSGCIILNGQMQLNKVNQQGTGTITVIGAVTPCLFINVKGNGNVNVCGRVGIQEIIHLGDGCVNIIGADSNSLVIHAAGKGMTTVAGVVNLKKVIACDYSYVYVYCVNSKDLYISQSNCSRVGLAGYVSNMNIDMVDSARFGGKYLHADNIYVKTRNWSHANVNPNKKIFAAALNKSSIYMFNSPDAISQYPGGSGVVLPMWNAACPSNPVISCPVPQALALPQRVYKQ